MRTSSGRGVRQRASTAVRRVLDISGFRKFLPRSPKIDSICGFRTRVLVQSRSYRLSPRLRPKVRSMSPSSRSMLVMCCPMHLSRTGCREGPVGFSQIRCSLAVLTGVRSALAVAIATAWPTGATAVIIVATACSLLTSLEQPVIATLALVRSDATHVPDDRELGIGNKILLGVAGFEPVTPASRTQCTSSKLLIFLAVARVSVLFCSRSFHPIRCDFVAALLNENGAH
jgi:hypothetical protein